MTTDGLTAADDSPMVFVMLGMSLAMCLIVVALFVLAIRKHDYTLDEPVDTEHQTKPDGSE